MVSLITPPHALKNSQYESVILHFRHTEGKCRSLETLRSTQPQHQKTESCPSLEGRTASAGLCCQAHLAVPWTPVPATSGRDISIKTARIHSFALSACQLCSNLIQRITELCWVGRNPKDHQVLTSNLIGSKVLDQKT